MGISKVILNGVVKVDLTQDTVDETNLLAGETATGADGEAVEGTIASKASADLTVSGATVTAPAGYYAEAASKAVAAGSATTPATTITANPSISVSSSGLITASVSGSKSVTPTVSAGYVSSGTAGTVSVSGSKTEQLSTQGATTITPTTSSQTAVAAGKYTTGAVTVGAIPSEYIIPSGTLEITENGEGIDVSQYAEVDVDVPGQIPTGTKYVDTDVDGEGPWDVSGYQYCSVDYATFKDGKMRIWFDVDDNETVSIVMVAKDLQTIYNWGDGTTENMSAETMTHTYTHSGIYVCEILPAQTSIRLAQYGFGNSNSDPNTNVIALETPYNNYGLKYYGTQYCLNLKRVTINSPVTNVDSYAFRNSTALVSVTLPDTITTISPYAFRGCTSLALTSLPDGVTLIDSSAFRDCTSLALTSLPEGLTSIGGSAFRDCTSLALTSLPDGLTSIGGSTFYGCTSITYLVLPSSVTDIDQTAFYKVATTTNKLTLTILATTPPTLGSSAFTTSTLNKIYVPAASLEAYKTATNWSAYASYMEAIA